MVVSIVCFGAMRDYLPSNKDGNRASVELGTEATVGDLVDQLGAPRKLVFSVLVDGIHSDLQAPLWEGAEVTLMPPFAGGQ